MKGWLRIMDGDKHVKSGLTCRLVVDDYPTEHVIFSVLVHKPEPDGIIVVEVIGKNTIRLTSGNFSSIAEGERYFEKFFGTLTGEIPISDDVNGITEKILTYSPN